MKYLLEKGDQKEEEKENMNDQNVNELITSAGTFLLAKYGPDPKLEEKKSVIKSLHDLFNYLDQNSLHKKMMQWIKNKRRNPKKALPKKAVNDVEELKVIGKKGLIVVQSSSHPIDIEEIPVHVVSKTDYLDYDELGEEEEAVEILSDDEVEEYDLK